MGWYNNALFTGEPHTTITAGTHGNQALWAKWIYNNSVTSENQLKSSLYPNPARESVHITCDKEIITLQLLSISGVVLETVHTKSKEVSMTLTDIASGIYVVVYLQMKTSKW